ncbi:MAG TPA: hypothetical protein VLC95_15145 [Anaerolineae bacterium]|nr:hypothetical protein [Anaerolineae bacterium]
MTRYPRIVSNVVQGARRAPLHLPGHGRGTTWGARRAPVRLAWSRRRHDLGRTPCAPTFLSLFWQVPDARGGTRVR